MSTQDRYLGVGPTTNSSGVPPRLGPGSHRGPTSEDFNNNEEILSEVTKL